MTPAIELRDVFRVHRTAQGDAAALQGASLTVEPGEHVCVLGPSGAGKSTLLRVIAGLEPPSAGVVRVLGHDVGRLSPRAAGALRREAIGFLDQRAEHNLAPALPVGEGIVLALALRGVGRSDRTARARELLEAVGLGDRAGALPAACSGGERQRLALCAALAHRPGLLLADEPTGELDAESAAAVRTLIAQLARAEGATVVVVSHDPAMAAVADRAVRLRDGRIGGERRGGAETLVIDERGWVRLPPALLAAAGIGDRASAHPGPGEVAVRAAGPRPVDPPAAAPGPAPAPRTATRVECRALSRAYGARTVIVGLSAAFAPGRLTVVTGRSGSGKTTLLRLLAGLEVPDAGEVTLDGRSLAGLDAEGRAEVRRAQIGFLAQDVHLPPFLTARETVELACAVRGAGGEPAGAALARLGLAERAGQRVSRLSAGERQRVALARALVCGGGLLLADEPTSRLDEAAAGVVAGELARAAAAGRTVICATHEPLVIARADHSLALG